MAFQTFFLWLPVFKCIPLAQGNLPRVTRPFCPYFIGSEWSNEEQAWKTDDIFSLLDSISRWLILTFFYAKMPPDSTLKHANFTKSSGGACPQTPLQPACFTHSSTLPSETTLIPSTYTLTTFYMIWGTSHMMCGNWSFTLLKSS